MMPNKEYKTEFSGDPNAHPIPEFSESMTGKCLCGSITVTIRDKDLFTKPRGHLWFVSSAQQRERRLTDHTTIKPLRKLP